MNNEGVKGRSLPEESGDRRGYDTYAVLDGYGHGFLYCTVWVMWKGVASILRSTPEGPHMVCSHVREPRLGARQRVGLKQSGVYQYSRGLPNFVQVCAWWIAQQMQNGMRCGVDDVRVHMRAFLRLTLIRSG